ncbi:MAG TPA: lamin tail domain-containing protein [Verrucomicrobiae bacterium]|nr:lamin tail domain-containing protein [Verrucomicrobiae bacterium]
MKPKLLPLSLFASVLLFTPRTASAQVVINEFAYDDAGTDDLEFIELYNAGNSPVDISGWVIGGFDTAPNPSVIINSGTTIPANGFFVVGFAGVGNVGQTIATSIFENDMETIELRNATNGLLDQVTYEANKATHPLPPEGGLWGNSTAPQGLLGTATFTSYARFLDGYDTGVNGRDFGQRLATPGAANSVGTVTSYTGPNVDSLAVGSEVPGMHGSFVAPRVIDPTSTNFAIGANRLNPNVIPPSPQGGNAMIMWDPSGGGNTGGSDFTIGANSSFNLYVYLDPRATTGADTEEWGLGLAGSEDPSLQNLFDGGANGSTGVGWIFQRNSAGAILRLVDFGAGGPTNSWITLGTISLIPGDQGWHELGLSLNGTALTGTFDSTILAGTTAANLIGSFWMDYREGFADNSQLRPLTIDVVPEPSTFALGAIGAASLLLLRRRKK